MDIDTSERTNPYKLKCLYNDGRYRYVRGLGNRDAWMVNGDGKFEAHIWEEKGEVRGWIPPSLNSPGRVFSIGPASRIDIFRDFEKIRKTYISKEIGSC